MKTRLVFVPPGGGKINYSLDFDLPGVPQPGDYITILRKDNPVGTEDFIVRRTWWHLGYPDSKTHHGSDHSPLGHTIGICVECEFGQGPYSTDEHRRTCVGYKAEDLKGTAY